MTRDAAREVERQLRKRYPGGRVEVTRVFGGVQVTASDGHGWVFIRAATITALLTDPRTEPPQPISSLEQSPIWR